MGFLDKIFGNAETAINSYADFWDWFQLHEKTFFQVIKNHKGIEKQFFDKVTPKLKKLNEGFFMLTGMYDEQTAELVVTVEGVVKNVVFAEELIAAAPPIQGWRFTALKPAIDISDIGIEMEGYRFDEKTICFYTNDHNGYPDEIDITVVNKDLNEENKEVVTNGTYIFLDNYLGELNFVTNIDHLNVVGPPADETALIPIGKLKDYLIWREKEFVEKYDGIFHETEASNYASFQATLENDMPLIATMNTDLLAWNAKASHPWVMVVEIPYKGDKDNGMPDQATYDLMNDIEDHILQRLKDVAGYLNVGRQTANHLREVYFCCKEFRMASKVMKEVVETFQGRQTITYDIYKDKYWQTFERFANVPS